MQLCVLLFQIIDNSQASEFMELLQRFPVFQYMPYTEPYQLFCIM